MPVLTLSGVYKSYGVEDILEDTSLVVHERDRVGVIGPNGSGKSTLFRVILGQEVPDRGEIAVPRGPRHGHLRQDPDRDPHRTSFEEAMKSLAHVQAAERRLRASEEELSRVQDPAVLARLAEEHGSVQEIFERGGGYQMEARARAVLAGVGLPLSRHDQLTGTLSGGEKCRVALAQVLLSDADLLLLDEPTNHLDLAGVEWLEEELITHARAVLVISHDRRFLDRVTNKSFIFSAGGEKLYPGNYTKAEVLRNEEARALASEVEKQQDFIRKEKAFIRKHIGSQRSREAKGRRTRLARVQVLSLPPAERGEMKLDLTPARRAGIVPLVGRNLSAEFGPRRLFSGLDLTLEPGDRLGTVGGTGTGKIPLLRVLAGRLAPATGEVDLGRNVDLGYFDQDQSWLPRSSTVYGTIRSERPLWTDFEIRSFLARMLFFDDEVEREVSVLSGGERSRVALALLLLRRPNMLFLDEPTNHLDIPARQTLEELLREFTGTLIVVSHDRWFLDQVTTRTLWVAQDGLFLYPTSFSEAAETRRMRQAAALAEREAERERSAKPAKETKKDPARKKRRPLATIEAEIIAKEDEKSTLLSELSSPAVYADGLAVKQRQTALAKIETLLEALNAEWSSHAEDGGGP